MGYLDRKWQKKPKIEMEKRGVAIDRHVPTNAGNYYNVTVDMRDIPDFPGDIASYCSTDHDLNGLDGIYMSYRKDGVWYTYDEGVANGDFDYLVTKPTSNPIYTDNVGSQCETPFILWVNDQFVMTYQMAGVGNLQSTVRALGVDGVNFTRTGVVLDYANGAEVGDGHTGYLRWGLNKFPDVTYKYVGYALHGGAGTGYQQLVGCDDPRTDQWSLINILQKTNGEIFVGTQIPIDNIISWITVDIGSLRQVGRYWLILLSMGIQTSGTVAAAKITYWLPLDDDGVTLVGEPILAIPAGDYGSYDALGAQITSIVDNDLFYDASTSDNIRRTASCRLYENTNEYFKVTQSQLLPPLNARVVEVDFESITSRPSNITEVIETSATIDYSTKVKITAGYDDGAYLFLDEGFIPDNIEFVEWWLTGMKTDTFPVKRKMVMGFASSKTKLADQLDTIMLTTGELTDNDNGLLKAIQKVGGSEVSSVDMDLIWPYGVNSSLYAQAPKSAGFRWYPSKGKLYTIAESGDTFDEITLDETFDTSKTLYPFFGMRTISSGYTCDESYSLVKFKIK